MCRLLYGTREPLSKPSGPYRSLLAIVVARDTNREPNKAGMKPETVNPSKKLAANQNKMAFKTKMNRPRVTMVIGSVSTNKIGRTIRFSTPSTSDAIRAA